MNSISTSLRAKGVGLLVTLCAAVAGSFAQGNLPTVTLQPSSQAVAPGQPVTIEMTISISHDEFFGIDNQFTIQMFKDGAEAKTGFFKRTFDPQPDGSYVLTVTYDISSFSSASAGTYALKIQDKNGHVFLADGGSDTVRIITKGGGAGTPPLTPPTVGTALPDPRIAALSGPIFKDPRGIAVDSAGNMFVGDLGNNVIRKITPDGTVSTFAGTVGQLGQANGTGAAARFIAPAGLAIDASDNLYVCDSGNSSIRKITPAGVVTTLAGNPNGGAGTADGTGTAARFFSPYGLALDGSGNLYVADSLNHAIRKVTPAGAVTTVAGTTGKSGNADGTGTAAQFNYPCGVALDATGNLYVTDGQNYTIRKITPAGVVTTLAGSAGNSGSADGTGNAARFYYPWGIVVDNGDTGNIFIADSGNGTLRMITPAGVVTTIAGVAGSSGSSDGTGNTARFTYPYDLKIAPYTLFSRPATLTLPAPTSAPAIATQPANQAAAAGASATFTVNATGATSYQWQKNGTNISGATSVTLTLSNVSATDVGTYRVIATNSLGSATSSGATLTISPVSTTGRLINLSILTNIAAPGDSFTLGVVIGGSGTSGTKPLLVRAAGPALGALGVGGTLGDPNLEFFSGSTKIAENDNWGGDATLSSAFTAVGAFPYPAATSKDAAIYNVAVAAGGNSVRVTGVGGTTGTVIAEIYDSTPTAAFIAATPRLINVSVLKNLGAGFTLGFVVGGSSPCKVLVRAVGPGLAAVGVPPTAVVADPNLKLFAGATQIDQNDDWGGTTALTAAMSQIGAFALTPSSKDAALLATLQPGSYSVQIAGATGNTGLVIAEVYEVP